MEQGYQIIQSKCSKDNFQKLVALNNPAVLAFVAEFIQLTNPVIIFVRSDTAEDADYIRRKAIEMIVFFSLLFILKIPILVSCKELRLLRSLLLRAFCGKRDMSALYCSCRTSDTLWHIPSRNLHP